MEDGSKIVTPGTFFALGGYDGAKEIEVKDVSETDIDREDVDDSSGPDGAVGEGGNAPDGGGGEADHGDDNELQGKKDDGDEESKDDEDKPDDAKDDSGRKEEPRKRKVKVDGEEMEVTEEDAYKSYERVSASMKRFQEASAMRKEADQIKKKSEETLQSAQVKIDAMFRDPERLGDFLIEHYPVTFQKILDTNISRIIEEQNLYEKDKDLYATTIRNREEQRKLRRERAQLEDSAAKAEADKKSAEDKRLAEYRDQVARFLDTEIPLALKAAGLPEDAYSGMVGAELRRVLDKNWTDGQKLDKQYLLDCSRELLDSEDMKKYIAKFSKQKAKIAEDKESKPEETTKPRKATIVSPALQSSKPFDPRTYRDEWSKMWRR